MTGSIEGLYKVAKEDISKAAATFVDAFQHDPIWNTVFADYASEYNRARAVYETPVKYCLKYGSVYSISEKLEGVAAWVPGEFSNLPLWRVVRSGAALSGMKVGFKIAKQIMPIFKPIEKDRKENMKGKDYIYLFVLGVAQRYQGLGFGGKLLSALIAESKQSGKTLYLETETEKNVKLYEKFGFKLIKKTMLPVIDLPMWEMMREMDG